MATEPSRRSLGLLVGSWIEAHCVIPDRDDAGQPFQLYPEQFTFLDSHYELKPEATPGQLAPAFRYRRSMLVRPQKFGKGPLTAAQVCAEAVGPVLFAGWAVGGEVYRCSDHRCGCGWDFPYREGDPMGRAWSTPLIQITATSAEQTDNIYDALRPMITKGPLSELIPRTGEEFIRLPNDGRIDVVTSSATSRLGQRVTFVPQDEVGLWVASNKMTKVADTQYRGLAGMGGRAVLTTNGWDPAEHSVAQQQYESMATDILRDFKQADPTLSYGDKRERRKIHLQVYGGALTENGGHVPLDAIEAEAVDLMGRGDRAQAERFFGNRIVAGLGSWLDDGVYAASQRSIAVPDGSQVCLGFDGSDSDDWTVIRAETLDGHRFTPTYAGGKTIWIPADHRGQIPRSEVNAAVEELFRKYRVQRMYCDPPYWQSEIGEWALAHGEKVVVEFATYRTVPMHSALTRTVSDLVSGRVTHDDCEVTAAHYANARKAARPGDRYLLVKPAQHQKIDAVMADVLAGEAAADAREDGWGATKTFYAYTG